MAEGSDQAVRAPVAIRLTLKPGAEARLGARVPVERLTFNEVGACLLGIFGGHIGRRFLDDLLVTRGGGRRSRQRN